MIDISMEQIHRYASECRHPSKVHRVWLGRFDVNPVWRHGSGAVEARCAQLVAASDGRDRRIGMQSTELGPEPTQFPKIRRNPVRATGEPVAVQPESNANVKSSKQVGRDDEASAVYEFARPELM